MEPEPKFGKAPLELLAPRKTRRYIWQKIGIELTAVGLGTAMGCAANWVKKRPYFSGIQKHITAVASCVVVAEGYKYFRDSKNAERDAILRHYIKLHPEDFPPPERKQYKDIIQDWTPIR